MAKSGSSAMEGKQAELGASNEWNIPASLSLFPKSEKIAAMLYIGNILSYQSCVGIGSNLDLKSRRSYIQYLFLAYISMEYT
jgi:hypothetical protein